MTTRRRAILRQLVEEAEQRTLTMAEEKEENVEIPKGAIVFHMTPFGSVIDMTTESGRKLFHMASAPLGDVPFDGNSHNVNLFLNRCKERANVNPFLSSQSITRT